MKAQLVSSRLQHYTFLIGLITKTGGATSGWMDGWMGGIIYF